MPIIEVKRTIGGATLAEDVHTMLGGLLFPKGTTLYERELEFLEAFMIERIVVCEPDAPHGAGLDDPARNEPVPGKVVPIVSDGRSKPQFLTSFEKAVSTFKNLVIRVQGGQNIPVMEVRELMTPLIQQVQDKPELLLSLHRISRVESYAYEHSIAVGLLSYMIGRWIKVPEKEWMQIALAGTLLDIGKTRIDRRILQKPGKLTTEEFEEIKKHPLYGYQLIKASPGLSEGVALAALQHHEREDGSGYPLGLTRPKLHLYSKITAVADVFHAMCSNRVYQKAKSTYVVAEQLLEDSFGKLDPQIVHTFVNRITRFAAGTVVELSDGSIGKVIFTDNNHPTRPMIELNGRILNLVENRTLSIVKILE
ncbi:HD-GYP domain-containing protein [Brevibacillus composti]|uniref:HD-GYP domain-containing protein n=1 Tax=Brevibacillus composti TaxID=2796470 RepID=A0A7T5JNV0_9BACL|nr:HD-GYP domain-containing protein [Brevibacillus composti]QQE74477.1 HD-GYP domain-containing protein [Brevibacillus composti]QUO41559.1 HD-GYP domain-containing protein [Brevibacillus composti]